MDENNNLNGINPSNSNNTDMSSPSNPFAATSNPAPVGNTNPASAVDPASTVSPTSSISETNPTPAVNNINTTSTITPAPETNINPTATSNPFDAGNNYVPPVDNSTPQPFVADSTNNVVPTESTINTPQPSAVQSNSTNTPNANVTTKKTGKILPIILVIIAVFMVVLVGLGFGVYAKATQPQKVAEALVDKALSTYVQGSNDYNNNNYKFGLDVDFSYKGLDEENFLNKLINKSTVDFSVLTQDKRAQVTASVKYENEDLVNFDAIYDSKNEKGVFKVNELADKYFYLPDEDLDEFKESLNSLMNSTETVPAERIDILRSVINENLAFSNVSKEKEKVGNKSTTAYKYEITTVQLINSLKNICSALKDNNAFLKTFNNPEEITDTISNLYDELDYLDVEDYENSKITIKINMAGFIPSEFVKCEINANIDEDTASLTIDTQDNKTYNYSLTYSEGGESETFSGAVSIEKTGSNSNIFNLSFSNNDEISLKIKLDYEKIAKVNIPSIDSLGAKNTYDLSEEEQEELYDNLQKSKIYELVTDYYSSIYSSYSNQYNNSNNYNPYSEYGDDYSSYDLYGDEDEDYSSYDLSYDYDDEDEDEDYSSYNLYDDYDDDDYLYYSDFDDED